MSTRTEHHLELITREPKRYHVYLLNDHYTSMDFVMDILMGVFRKNFTDAYRIMMEVHQSGRGLCGTYSHEIAETKVQQVAQLAREGGFPLKAIYEEVS